MALQKRWYDFAREGQRCPPEQVTSGQRCKGGEGRGHGDVCGESGPGGRSREADTAQQSERGRARQELS